MLDGCYLFGRAGLFCFAVFLRLCFQVIDVFIKILQSLLVGSIVVPCCPLPLYIKQVFTESVVQGISHHFDVVLPCSLGVITIAVNVTQCNKAFGNLFLLIVLKAQIGLTLAAGKNFRVKKLL